ncbi:hypothetical protein [Brevibacillus centrosporus]|uniref:hypothetical protein n=1 Tax=Brevibacillus centrosporus TaxID=54910 RepID=UPI0037FFEB90
MNTRYVLYDEKIPHIKYLESSQTLRVQVSIPKFLYGNNVKTIGLDDINLFFVGLQERIEHLFGVTVPHEDWLVERCDVCWNFQVGNDVGNYVRMLSKQKFAFKNTKSYNQDQTVEFSNKSSRIIFYDKQEEVAKSKETKALIEQAKGILRLEINSSKHDMKKFAPTWKAVELLSQPFFDYMVGKVLDEVDYLDDIEELNVEWLKENKDNISKIETYIGFNIIRNLVDESTLKKIYPSSTLATRKSLAKKMTIPKGNCLKPLTIIKESLPDQRTRYFADNDKKSKIMEQIK